MLDLFFGQNIFWSAALIERHVACGSDLILDFDLTIIAHFWISAISFCRGPSFSVRSWLITALSSPHAHAVCAGVGFVTTRFIWHLAGPGNQPVCTTDSLLEFSRLVLLTFCVCGYVMCVVMSFTFARFCAKTYAIEWKICRVVCARHSTDCTLCARRNNASRVQVLRFWTNKGSTRHVDSGPTLSPGPKYDPDNSGPEEFATHQSQTWTCSAKLRAETQWRGGTLRHSPQLCSITCVSVSSSMQRDAHTKHNVQNLDVAVIFGCRKLWAVSFETKSLGSFYCTQFWWN